MTALLLLFALLILLAAALRFDAAKPVDYLRRISGAYAFITVHHVACWQRGASRALRCSLHRQRRHQVQLLAFLPHERDARRIDPNASHVFAAGAFVQGSEYGLIKRTVHFRLSVAMICRFFKHYMPD